MKRLPIWMVLTLVLVSVLMLWIGYDERHEAGYLPFILGIGWTLFTLKSAKDVFADE